MKVKLVETNFTIPSGDEEHFHGCPWCGDPETVHNEGECPVVRVEPDEESAVETESEILENGTVVEIESPYPAENPYIDKTMVGQVLTRSVLNTTSTVWKKCFPCAFWIMGEKRLADPASKSQCLGDIRPGLKKKFVVMIPRFPIGEKPDLLRVAILEDGVAWHTVEDIRVR